MPPITRKTKKTDLKSPELLKDFIIKSLDDDKAEEIEVIDLRGQTAIADYMIVASGRSSRQVAALADKLADRLRENGMKGLTIEGTSEGNWAIVDALDIIVHIFKPDVRAYYGIEKMWNSIHTDDAKPTKTHTF